MKIREFSVEDQTQIISLWQACGLIKPWNDPTKDINRKVKDGTSLFLIGEKNNQIMATAMGGYDGHRGWINYLAILPNEQGNGYAREMMTKIEHRLIEQGCPKLNLQIRETNLDVVRFYEALGYKTDACISMGKRLIKD